MAALVCFFYPLIFACVNRDSISASSVRNSNGEFLVCNDETSDFTVVDGSVVFVINQVRSTTNPMNLSSIPTYTFPSGDVLAFLLCSPNVSIQTRQVRTTGNGNLTLGKLQRSQGNIDLHQANYLLSHVLLDLKANSGPSSQGIQAAGTDLMYWFFFGPNAGFGTKHYPLNLPPASNTSITAAYKQVIQSATKVFLSGGINTTNAPGGYTEEQMIFTSSLGHVVTSVILFVFLTIALVAAQFRKRRVAFTFVNVAAALADFDVSQKCVEMTLFKAGTTGEGKVLPVKLVTNGDGQLKFAYQNIDEDHELK
jgi:hypothetical protein